MFKIQPHYILFSRIRNGESDEEAGIPGNQGERPRPAEGAAAQAKRGVMGDADGDGGDLSLPYPFI